MSLEPSTSTERNDVIVEEVHLPPMRAVAVRATVDVAALPAFFADAFHEIEEAVREAGARVVGPPFARYHTAPPHPIDVEAVMPVEERVSARGRAAPLDLEGGAALQALHVGPYDAMAPVYDAIARAADAAGLEAAGPPREVYLSDPGAEPDPRRWRTLVVQPTRPRR